MSQRIVLAVTIALAACRAPHGDEPGSDAASRADAGSGSNHAGDGGADAGKGSSSGDAPYPRIAVLAIGGDLSYPQANWEFYGRFDVMIMGADYETWANSGRDRETIVNGIKAATHPQGAAAPATTKVIQYFMFQEAPSTDAAGSPVFYDAVTSNNWWLYQSTVGGAIAESGAGDSSPAVDYGADVTTKVSFGQPAASGAGMGLRPPEWFADYFANVYLSKAGKYGTNAGLAAPSLDGVFADDIFPTAYGGGDWSRDGSDDGSGYGTYPSQWMQQGQANFYARLQSDAPGTLGFANYGGYGNPSVVVDQMEHVVNGGLFEALIGKGFSLDAYQTFDMALTAFNKAYDMSAAPNLVCMGGTIPDGGSALSGNLPFAGAYNAPSTAVNGEYQWARYNLGTCLMTDGYCVISSQLDHTGANDSYDASVLSLRYYDEYGGNYAPLAGNTVPPLPTSASAPPRGYLGAAVDARQTTARWQIGAGIGVFAREFEHGIVILNPKGNGVVTVTTADLPGTWHRLNGTQDPAVNSGGAFTGVTLQDRDAIVLLRD